MNFQYNIFDAYGTLFDVHASTRQFAHDIGEKYGELSEIWRQKQLEYTWIATLMDEYEDFWILTKNALDFATEKIENNITPELKQKMLDAYWQLQCFPEVPACLQKLKNENKQVAILSNGSPDMLQAAVDFANIGELVCNIFSINKIKKFKPTKNVYDMICQHYKIKPAQVLFHSSNRWDIAGAKKFGFQTMWINRNNAPDEYKMFAPDFVVNKLPN